MDDPHFLKMLLLMWAECTVCNNKARHEYLMLCVGILLKMLLASITRIHIVFLELFSTGTGLKIANKTIKG